MRIFIAIDLPQHIRNALRDLQRDLRSASPSARWVAPEAIHITLKFLGEAPEARLPEIDDALAGLTWKPFTVKVGGVGFFPGARSPRVFWAGLEAPTMRELAGELDARLERVGFDKEQRAFRAHVTLARARENRMDAAMVAAAAAYEERAFGEFLVDRMLLFESLLKPAGAVYNKLKEYPLTTRPLSHGQP